MTIKGVLKPAKCSTEKHRDHSPERSTLRVTMEFLGDNTMLRASNNIGHEDLYSFPTDLVKHIQSGVAIILLSFLT